MTKKLHLGAMGAGPGSFKELRSDSLKVPALTLGQKASLISLVRSLPPKGTP